MWVRLNIGRKQHNLGVDSCCSGKGNK
uniref:Uncharacterized protein n=1 Tax=Anguilla anguilla TaxID=7936 RepID=A0A0E9T5Y8_ANGAN